nr:DUF5994 family protein [Streptomyces sp. MMG1121]
MKAAPTGCLCPGCASRWASAMARWTARGGRAATHWNWSCPRWSSLDPSVGTVTRVTVGTATWPDAPQEVMAPGHVIEVVLTDLAAEVHAITVDCGTVGRWELLVIPPDEPAGAATRLLTAAADPGNPLSAPRLLALVESGLDGQGTWESEGGSGLR